MFQPPFEAYKEISVIASRVENLLISEMEKKETVMKPSHSNNNKNTTLTPIFSRVK